MPLNLPQRQIEPFNVLAFDPGGTTGWAQAILPAHMIVATELVRLDDIELRTGEFGPDLHHNNLYIHIQHTAYEPEDGNVPWPEVVSEPFHYRQNIVEQGEKFRGKVELISAEYIGVIRLACQQLGLEYYDRFTPGEAKKYVSDKKLELLGWLQTPKYPKRHQNDALRQLVKYLIVKKKIQHPITTSWRIAK